MSDKRSYKLDKDTEDLLYEVMQYALTLVDIQLAEDIRDDMYNNIAEVYERFGLSEVRAVYPDDTAGDSTVVPFQTRFGKPSFGVIKGGKDDDPE